MSNNNCVGPMTKISKGLNLCPDCHVFPLPLISDFKKICLNNFYNSFPQILTKSNCFPENNEIPGSRLFQEIN